MTTRRAISQKILAVAITVSVIGGSFAGTAEAKPPLLPKIPVFLPGFPKPGFPKWPYGGGYGYGAAALAGGLALGTMAATFAGPDCTVLRRVVEDENGNQYVRHVRVCE